MPKPNAVLDHVRASRVTWDRCVRIVPARYPPVAVYEQAMAPEALDDALAALAQVVPDIAHLVGDLGRVPRHERVTGPGSGYVMSAFTFTAPGGSRFSDGSYGVFYAARDESTAIAETRFHRERLLADVSAPPQRVEMRVLHADVDADFHDVRELSAVDPARAVEIYDPDPARLGAAQALGRALYAQGSNGIVYRSVRRSGGECLAVFRPPLVLRCRAVGVLSYAWDGAHVAHVYEIRLRAEG